MTISAVVPDIAFAGSSNPGTLGPFSLVKSGTPLVFYANSEVVVLRYDSVTDTTPTLLVEGTDYTLTGGPSTGSITLTSPQTGLLTAERLYVTTLSALAQSLDLVNGGNFSSSNLERRLDVIFQILQQHAREIKSTMRFAMFDTDEIPKTTPLGAVIDKVPYVTGTASAPTVAFLDALVLNDLSELSDENLANIATVVADLAGADTIGLVAAAIDDVETVADNLEDVGIVADNIDAILALNAGSFQYVVDVRSATIIDFYESKGGGSQTSWVRRRLERKVSADLNYDVWLITSIYYAAKTADNVFKIDQILDTPGAHECAIRQNGKADFMGNTAHGNEVITGTPVLYIDDVATPIVAGERHFCREAYLEQETIFYEYDADPLVEVGRCVRKWEFRDTAGGAMRLYNTFTWASDLATKYPSGFDVDFGYLAMFPYDGTFFTKTNWTPDGTLTTHGNANVTYPGTADGRLACQSITIQNDDGFSVTVERISGWPSDTATLRDTQVSAKRKIYLSWQGTGSGAPVEVFASEVWAAVTEYRMSVPTVYDVADFGPDAVTLRGRVRCRRTSLGNGEVIFESDVPLATYFFEGAIFTLVPSEPFSNGVDDLDLGGEFLVQIVNDADDKLQIQAPGGDWEELADDGAWTDNATPYVLCDLVLYGGATPVIELDTTRPDLSVTAEFRYVRNGTGNLEIRYQHYLPGRVFEDDWEVGDRFNLLASTHTSGASAETIDFTGDEWVVGSIDSANSKFYIVRAGQTTAQQALVDTLDDGWTSDATDDYLPVLMTRGAGSDDWKSVDLTLTEDTMDTWVMPPDTQSALVEFSSPTTAANSPNGQFQFTTAYTGWDFRAAGGIGATILETDITVAATGTTDNVYTLSGYRYKLHLINRLNATTRRVLAKVQLIMRT
jgi:hypothetical protein